MHLNEHSKQEQSSCQLLLFLSAFFSQTLSKHLIHGCANSECDSISPFKVTLHPHEKTAHTIIFPCCSNVVLTE